MRFLPALAFCAAISMLPAAAQTTSDTAWVTANTLPNIDFNGLTAAQKEKALKSLRKEGCTCGCQMKVAQCRVVDPPCGDSRTLAALTVEAAKRDRTLDQIHQELVSSKLAKMRANQNKILSDPIEIPVAGAPVRGPQKARITLIEFSDFECPYCSKAVATIDALLKAYPNDVKLIYKQFPLDMHPHARLAAAASLAAQEQGKFWEMHDKLFANARALSRVKILELARESGLDMVRFGKDLDSSKYDAHIAKDVSEGEEAGVQGTPTIFVNGKRYNGPVTEAVMKPLLDAELKGREAGRFAVSR